jgi:small nuclear ribonucleoprotein (snRNP)-like protein
MKFLDYFRPYPELRTVIVNLKSGTAFRGVVWRKRGSFVILRNAEILKDKAGGSRIDGEVLVERSDIDFIQVPY